MADREPGLPTCAIAGFRPATLLLAALIARLATQPRLALFPAGASDRAWWIAGGVALGQELLQLLPLALALALPRRPAFVAHLAGLGATLVLLLALQAADSRGPATVVAGMLLGQALPIAPFSGAALLRTFFRRRAPTAAAALATQDMQNWVAERLLARVGGSLLALLLVIAALSASVRADRWLAAGTLLLLAGSWLCQRRSLAAAYARRAGVLRSSSNPTASMTSRTSTDEV